LALISSGVEEQRRGLGRFLQALRSTNSWGYRRDPGLAKTRMASRRAVRRSKPVRKL
jgi:hypothetical protein